MSHIPVLLNEVLEALLPAGKTVRRVIDGTPGAGGHSKAMLDAGAESLLAIEIDPQAVAIAQETLLPYSVRATLVHGSYVDMAQHANAHGWTSVDAILLDVGVSSMHFDTPERGFSFRFDAPLDMRFNPQDSTRATAAEIVNSWEANDLAHIFKEYGEEKFSWQMAQAVLKHRPFETTRQLADALAAAMPHPKRGKPVETIHPATRVFQALRIAVNDELDTLARTLPIALDLLAPGGRLAVISFHSLEDRIVKQFFKEVSESFVPPPGMASLGRKDARANLITRKPIEVTAEEIAQNPRSRSAKLRVIEKI